MSAYPDIAGPRPVAPVAVTKSSPVKAPEPHEEAHGISWGFVGAAVAAGFLGALGAAAFGFFHRGFS